MPRKLNRTDKTVLKSAPTGSALVPVEAHARALAVRGEADGAPVVIRERDTTLVVGQPYPMRGLTIDAAEVYYTDGIRVLRPDGVWLGEADKVAWRDAHRHRRREPHAHATRRLDPVLHR